MPEAGLPLEVVELEAGTEGDYEAFVSRHPHALLYHSLRFRDFLIELLGCEPRYGMVRSAGEVAGVLPVMAATGPFGRVVNSLPYFGSNGGPLCGNDDEETMSALLHWYGKEADQAASATVVENPLVQQTDIPATLQSERISVVTPLPSPGGGREVLLQRIDSSARRNLLKAERSGVVVSVAGGDLASLDTLAHLHRLSMQLNGGQVKTPRFFELLPTAFRPETDYQLYLATVDGETLAALLVMFYGSVAEYYIPATLPSARPVQPMAALLCFAMSDAAERGCSLWNWGGSGLGNETLVRFKMKWGGCRSTYRCLTQLNDENLLQVPPDDLLAGYPGFYVRPFAPAPIEDLEEARHES